MYRFLFVPFVILALATFASHAASGQTPPATPRLVVSKRANPTTARVGETITYTYRITNSGSIPLTTLVARDDRLGEVDLAGTLPVFGAREATLTYIAQQSDTQAPLQNRVVVTGSAGVATTAVASATASVVVTDAPRLGLEVAKVPNTPSQRCRRIDFQPKSATAAVRKGMRIGRISGTRQPNVVVGSRVSGSLVRQKGVFTKPSHWPCSYGYDS